MGWSLVEKEIREQSVRPQLPHGDYVGTMDELACDLNLHRRPTCDDLLQVVTPFAYHRSDDEDVHPMTESLTTFITECKRGYLRSRVAFLNMIGHWNFTREIQNTYDPSQSGTVVGTSSFLPAHDLSSSDSVFDGVRYREEGVFTLTHRSDLNLSIQREDFYSYHPIEDTIQIHFIKNGVKENHFLTLRFQTPDPLPVPIAHPTSNPALECDHSNWWRAESDHWCSPDTYSAVYRFRFNRIHLEEIHIEMKCKGPFKDYITQTIYTRPLPPSL